jgi:BMFP domain-containing protein YqiC
MGIDNRLLGDVSRVATGAFSALSGVREEIEGRVRDQFERLLARMDMVTREEFEAVQAMAAQARAEQEALGARVAALEAALARVEAQAPAGRAAKTTKSAKSTAPASDEDPS